MEKNYKITNLSKFKRAIENLYNSGLSFREIEDKADLSNGTISKFLNSTKKRNMSSKNISKIISTFKLLPEDIGVKEQTMNKSSIRLLELLKENKISQSQLAKELGIVPSTISDWINNNREPNLYLIKSIAKKFNVHYLYLLGEIDTKSVYEFSIKENLGLAESAIDSIYICYKDTSLYGKEQHEHIKKEYGFNYIDVVNFILSNLNFFDVFYGEALRLMTYYTSPTYRYNFETLFNTIELDTNSREPNTINMFGTTDYDAPYFVCPETLSKVILSEKIKKMFDEFIEIKTKEKNIKKVSPLK